MARDQKPLSLLNGMKRSFPSIPIVILLNPALRAGPKSTGHVSAVDGDVKKKLRFDFYYIKNVSLWLDVLIALKTIRVIFGGIGAK